MEMIDSAAVVQTLRVKLTVSELVAGRSMQVVATSSHGRSCQVGLPMHACMHKAACSPPSLVGVLPVAQEAVRSLLWLHYISGVAITFSGETTRQVSEVWLLWLHPTHSPVADVPVRPT